MVLLTAGEGAGCLPYFFCPLCSMNGWLLVWSLFSLCCLTILIEANKLSTKHWYVSLLLLLFSACKPQSVPRTADLNIHFCTLSLRSDGRASGLSVAIRSVSLDSAFSPNLPHYGSWRYLTLRVRPRPPLA